MFIAFICSTQSVGQQLQSITGTFSVWPNFTSKSLCSDCLTSVINAQRSRERAVKAALSLLSGAQTQSAVQATGPHKLNV
jgi:hypothetical protein